MASKFEVFNGNADNEEILRIGTSSHFHDFESLVNDIAEFSSLRESTGLEVPRAVCLGVDVLHQGLP